MARVFVARDRLKDFLKSYQNSKTERSLMVKKIFGPEFMRKAAERKISHSTILTWKKVMRSILPLGSVSWNNKVKILQDGDEAFDSMWNSIKNAKKKVWLETYICEPDHIGMKTIELLSKARNAGCEVRLFVDLFGSANLLLRHGHLLSSRFGSGFTSFNFFPFRKKRTTTEPQESLSLWENIRLFITRNHRKILVVDDVAFCGGMNISSDWAGKKLGGRGIFRDLHMMIQGPAVEHLKAIILNKPIRSFGKKKGTFQPPTTEMVTGVQDDAKLLEELEEWEVGYAADNEEEGEEVEVEVGHDEVDDHQSPIGVSYTAVATPLISSISEKNQGNQSAEKTFTQRTPPEITSGQFIHVLCSLPFRRNIEMAFRTIMGNAESHAYITTPYFLPPRKIKASLLESAKRGVKVVVLTAGKSDVPLITWAARHVYDVFLRNGVRIFEMDSAFLHSKTLTIDGVYCCIGSFNLDFQSNRNLEVASSMLDPTMAEWLERRFHDDLRLSQEVFLECERRSGLIRVGWWISYQLVTTFFTVFGSIEKWRKYRTLSKELDRN